MEKDSEKIIGLIVALRRSIYEQKESSSEKSGSLMHLLVLKYIEEKKPIMRDISEYLGITPPSATSLVATLAKNGLIARKESKSDRRIVKLLLTPKGKRQLESHRGSMSREIGGRLEKLNSQERKQLLAMLEKIIR